MNRGAAYDRPKLVFIVTSHLTATAFLPGITRYLADAGWDVTVVCSPGNGLDLLAEPARIRVATVRMKRDPAVFADTRALVELARTLRTIEPDLVVTATPKASLLGTVAARMLGVPIVVHLMWGLRSETLTGVRRRLVQLLEAIATRFSHRVVACSRSLGGELVGARMVRPERLSVLGSGSSHGVDVARFAPRPAEPSPESVAVSERLNAVGSGPVVGFVGRLTPDKGVGVLVDAVEQLHASGHSCRLLMVGSCEDEAIVARLEQARADGLPVVLLQSNPDILPPYHLMDVHCLPTLREGFPNVCLEASACGLPTVTTDATGAVDSVIHGVTGLISKKNDVDSLAHALAALLDDDETRLKFGRAARQWVEEEFEAELVWRRHEEYLRSLLDTATSGGSVRTRGRGGERAAEGPDQPTGSNA